MRRLCTTAESAEIGNLTEESGILQYTGSFLFEQHSRTLRSDAPDAESPYNARIAGYNLLSLLERAVLTMANDTGIIVEYAVVAIEDRPLSSNSGRYN